MSALSRLAAGENRFFRLREDDVVVISAHPIPGNEWSVGRVIDSLHRRGVEVIHSGVESVHVSGHARQGELAMLMSVTRPEYFIPVHGEYRHMANHVRLAGVDGHRRRPGPSCARTATRCGWTAPGSSGTARCPGGYLFVDGSSVGDIGHGVLRDRMVLAEEGVVMAVATVDLKRGEVVGTPQIVTRGWAYDHDTEALLDEARDAGDQGPRAGADRRQQRPREPQPGGPQGARTPGRRPDPPAADDRAGDRHRLSGPSSRAAPRSGVPVTVTVREYPVTHCDDRHQATGGPVRVFAAEGQVRLRRRVRARSSASRRGVRPPGEGYVTVEAGTGQPTTGSVCWPPCGRWSPATPPTCGAWCWSPSACWPRWPSTPTRSARPATTPAGRRRPARMGPVPGSSGRDRPSGLLLLVGRRDDEGGPHRTRAGPRRHRGHADPSGRRRAGVAGRRVPGPARLDHPAVLGRRLGGGAHRQPAPGGARRLRGGHRAGGPPGGGHGAVHRRVGQLGRRRDRCAPPVGAPRWPGADRTRSPRTASTTTTTHRSVRPRRRAHDRTRRGLAAERPAGSQKPSSTPSSPTPRPSRPAPGGAPPGRSRGRSWR